jgi:predicted phage gp36 major capsid-like protein
MMPLQDFIARLEQEQAQHQQSAQSIDQRLVGLRGLQRLMGPRYEIGVTERTPRLHEWAYQVLKEAGQPLHVKAIAARVTALAGHLVTSQQIASALSHHRQAHGHVSPYHGIARGLYGLKEHL